MSTSSLFVLIPFLIAVLATVLTVINKRKELERSKQIHREPHLNNTNAMNAESLDDYDIVVTAPETASSEPKKPIPQTNKSEFIIMNLLAENEHPYAGYELLQALLTAGLRFGKMNIFHRYEEMNGRGVMLFSLASIVEPGTFEMNKMGGFSTCGLTLFMRIDSMTNSLKTFEIMHDTAQQLVDDLGGIVCDEKRNPITEEKIVEWRDQILSFNQQPIEV